MKMLDFVCIENQALHKIDISLTPEQKSTLEANRIIKALWGRLNDFEDRLKQK